MALSIKGLIQRFGSCSSQILITAFYSLLFISIYIVTTVRIRRDGQTMMIISWRHFLLLLCALRVSITNCGKSFSCQINWPTNRQQTVKASRSIIVCRYLVSCVYLYQSHFTTSTVQNSLSYSFTHSIDHVLPCFQTRSCKRRQGSGLCILPFHVFHPCYNEGKSRSQIIVDLIDAYGTITFKSTCQVI